MQLAHGAIDIDRSSALPLWSQVRDHVRDWVQAEGVQPNAKLPSEAALSGMFGVSRTVIREATAQLVAEGLIYKVNGAGAFVSERAATREFLSSTIGFRDDVVRRGSRIRTTVEEILVRAPTAAERSMLALGEGASVVSLTRRREVDDQPAVRVVTAVPASLVPGLERVSLADTSLYDVLRRRYGLVPARAERWVSAVGASASDAAQLGVEPGEPVLRIESVAWLPDGTPMEYYDALHRSDVERLHITAQQ